MKTTGISEAKRKDGSIYYKAYFTFKGRHISLGSFDNAKDAAAAYTLASKIVRDKKHFHMNTASEIEGYPKNAKSLSFEKWVMLINLRDSGIYSHNPIYLQRRFFDYYLDPDTMLRFDIEELFYYTNHKIQKRGGHFFVADYGMQVNILTRYGIKNYAVCDRDYRFVNGEKWDFRAGNVEIINSYHGVTERLIKGEPRFVAKIHVNGDFIIGRYKTVEEAATAYNKAADYLEKRGLKKHFPRNFVETVDEVEYARIYHSVRISSKLAAIKLSLTVSGNLC